MAPSGNGAPRSAADGASAAVRHAEDGHLLDYVRLLSKRRWTLAAAFLVVVLPAVVYIFIKTPIYEARVRLMVDSSNPSVVEFQQTVDAAQSGQADHYHETQLQLLRSRSLARRTLDELDLWDAPIFLEAGTTVEAADEAAAKSRTIDGFLKALRTLPVGDSGLIDITYRSTDPDLAAAVINTHAKAFIAQNLDFRFLASRNAGEWLVEQLETQRRAVEKSEAALQLYQQEHGAVPLEDLENIVVQRLSELTAAHTRAKTELIAKESEYRQLEAATGSADAVGAFPAVMSNRVVQGIRAELTDLRRRRSELAENLGPRHPDMIKVNTAIDLSEAELQVEIAKVIASVKNEFLAAQVQARRLAAEVDGQKKEALKLSEIRIDSSVLVREAESNRQIYDTLLQRAKETGVSAQLPSSNIRIVDLAEVPTVPIGPRRGLFVIITVLVGGVFAVGLAFFSEHLDQRITTPDEMKFHLGLSVLGMIPTVRSKNSEEHGRLLISEGVPSVYREAVRRVRTGVMFSPASGKRSLVVTSSGPDEGKSTVVANLGIGLTQAGHSVLVIDADMRRPSLHTGASDSQVGLSELLVGAAKSRDVLRKTSVPGLWLLPAGKPSPNSAELLGSAAFEALHDSLLETFDWVLIDSPPVMAFTDASVLAHTAGGVIFLIGADMTSRHVAKQAIDQLQIPASMFVGGILNRVDFERNRYYYSNYSRPEYVGYYVEQPATGAPPTLDPAAIQL